MSILINGLGGTAGFGENFLDRNDDGSTSFIDVTSIFESGLNFFGTTYNGFYINNNGNITFNSALSTFTPFAITGNTNQPIIAPFFADVDTRAGEITPSSGGNSTGSNLVYYDFDTSTDAMTITWDDVGEFSNGTTPNAFQLQLQDLGTGDFTIKFVYEEIEWLFGSASNGEVARAGFSAADGSNFFELPQSGNAEQMRELETASNINQPGVFLFSVNNGNPNQPPIDIELSQSNIDENISNGTVIGNLTTTDPDAGDTHTYSLIDDAGGRFAINGNQLVVADGSLLDFETNTSHSIAINTQDAGGLNYQETFTIALNDINEAPLAVNDTATTDEDNNTTINVLANDTDEDGDTLSISGVTGSTGSVTIDGDNILYNPNGQFEFLNAGDTATDTFTYTVNDGNGLTDTASVTVTINGVDEVIGNENPVLANNNGLTVDEDAVGNIISTQLQVTDADNTAAEITYTITDVTDNGNLFLDGTQITLNDTFTQADIDNNRLTYDHDGSETTSDSFNFTVADGAGGNIGSSMFDITVNPVNDAPVANNDAATTNQNQAVTITAAQLLANDTDVEGDTLSIASVGNATNGSVALNGSDVVFTPDNDFNGAASFAYTLSDGSLTDSATVSVTVNPVSSNEILGTPGRDVLMGDSADNIITGFQGRDMLTGNGGADKFVYTDIRDAGDIITDFELGSDKIVLTQLLDSLGYTGSDAIGDGYVSFGSSRGDALVQIDQDGMGSGFISRPLVLLQGVTEENLSANAENSFVF